MKKTVPEPEAELLSASEIHDDVISLQSALEQRKAERQAYNISTSPNTRNAFPSNSQRDMCRRRKSDLASIEDPSNSSNPVASYEQWVHLIFAKISMS